MTADLRHAGRLASRVVRPVGEGPELLCLFVNSRCDAHCAHCFDHGRRGPEVIARDLEPWELHAIARKLPPLYYLILTGGEPYLRDDLGEIALSFARHARPRILATPTNGGRPDTILATVRAVLAGLPADVLLSVNVSIDGVGPLHDRIRGVPGLFERASETVRRLLVIDDDRLLVGVITVVSALNEDGLDEVMSYALDDLGAPSWAPFLVRGDPRDPGAGEVDLDRYSAAARALERRVLTGTYAEAGGFGGAALANAKNVVRRSLIEQTLREGRRVVPCRAGTHAAVVWADGRVGACELREPDMGDLRDFDHDLGLLWRSPSARSSRRAVREADCACTHENVLSTSVTFDWRLWPRLALWAHAFRRTAGLPAPASVPAPAEPGEVEVSCFVPAWNEAPIIGTTVSILDRCLSRVAHGHEIFVVDDGSDDGTAARVEALGLPRVRVIQDGPGPSYRGHLARHLLDGAGRYVLFMDADLTADEDELGHLLDSLREGGDAAIASRTVPGARTVRGPVRLGLSAIYNAGLRRIFATTLRDHQCGLKVFRRSLIEGILAEMGPTCGAERGWFWDAEVLIRAQRHGAVIAELPTTWSNLRRSRARVLSQHRMLPWIVRLYLEGPR